MQKLKCTYYLSIVFNNIQFNSTVAWGDASKAPGRYSCWSSRRCSCCCCCKRYGNAARAEASAKIPRERELTPTTRTPTQRKRIAKFICCLIFKIPQFYVHGYTYNDPLNSHENFPNLNFLRPKNLNTLIYGMHKISTAWIDRIALKYRNHEGSVWSSTFIALRAACE